MNTQKYNVIRRVICDLDTDTKLKHFKHWSSSEKYNGQFEIQQYKAISILILYDPPIICVEMFNGIL